ncbi:MAG: GUN4 domain-containing protein [Limnospira sp. PMC 1291.21]|uniref:GUN4 domain-containing protein n=2 Tax=Limnospira TaxID=2596745 RepID=UPI0028E0C3C7|nr:MULTISPECIES: GUN4 domain-containing protein [unclassified Limnospira]MDT9180737.1 GUN4 domain-containing protein [Limnospira sp. PMC 1238.20]MDT9206345.1 GUN4 domain-containing protein [Limnospira sp. PMC 1243.20]MDT9211448.1 GUN4 domain-containing protein [Limnospira sp. PMC 1252.20]MDT9231782.1 GUN4 domain-containing protein [Limnospira sp. PMC 1242.20]MDT9247068.1 GUN4 domain-containing protein [Limnospira sp. PMC 1249.20]
MMAKCPVCETEYTPNEVETCSVCGYDLTPYPPVIGGIPSGFLEKEKKRIAAAKRVWQLSQSQVESAQLMVSHLQSQLDETTRKIDGFTTTQSRLESQIEAIASQLESQRKAIASQLESQRKAIASQLQSQSSQIEAIASQLESITEAVADITPIVSSSGFDYTELDRLLKSGEWKAADQETTKMMWRVAGKTRGYLYNDDIKNFPCEDLRIIDGLWVKHSNGRFGFSVQKQIYINCGGLPDGRYPGDTIWERYCGEVGWRVNGSYISWSDCTFSAAAPLGHLPGMAMDEYWGVFLESGVALFCRAQTCKL